MTAAAQAAGSLHVLETVDQAAPPATVAVTAESVRCCSTRSGPLEGRKEILLLRATAEVDWHVNVWSEQINGSQIYQDKQ